MFTVDFLHKGFPHYPRFTHLNRKPEGSESDDHNHHQTSDALPATMRLLGQADATILPPEAYDHPDVEAADESQWDQIGAGKEGHLIH